MGGTINRLLESGDNEVHYVAFSICEESVPEGFPKDVLYEEGLNSAKALGIPKENVSISKYKVRMFHSYRQEILDEMVKLRKEINPEMIFVPSTEDIHQDHQVVCNETIRAFRRTSSIYGYDFPWNILHTAKLNLFYELSEDHLKAKIDSAQCFKSQLVKENNCLTPEYISSLAMERGNRIGAKYAEAFELVREIRRLSGARV
jgi:LmbE family N-acetylglucosaminyl deacetylase